MKLKLSLAVAAAAALTLAGQPALASDSTFADLARRAVDTPRVTTPPAPRAGTSVVVGEPVGGDNCGTTDAYFQLASASASYTVPGTGVLTSFTYPSTGAGAVRLLAATIGPATGHLTLVGKSAATPVPAGTTNTVPTRIPVPAGTLLGLQVSDGGMNCGATTMLPGDVVASASGFNPDVQTDVTLDSAFAGGRIGIAATWEPDADRDGFGDVSQDACPQSAATQAACPAPNTKAKGKHPVTSNGRGKVKIKFKSTVRGSTFTCAVDGKKAKPCSSPFVKQFGLGRHKVVITATSPFGIADPKPLKVKLNLQPA